MAAPDNDTNTKEYTIDELAAVAHVPSRTIRFYQSKGALKGPTIRGRVAYYNDEHLERLKLIAQLQDRGLRIDAIRELVARIDKGEVDVGEWLGLEAQLKAPWANDQPRTVTEDELFELAGSRRAGMIGDLVRTRLVKRQGDVYLVRSPALLHSAMKLEQAGVDLETAAEAAEILRRHIARAAEEVTQHFFRRAMQSESIASSTVEASTIFRELRPIGLEAVRVVFGQEMERVLRELVESGKTAKLTSNRKGGK